MHDNNIYILQTLLVYVKVSDHDYKFFLERFFFNHVQSYSSMILGYIWTCCGPKTVENTKYFDCAYIIGIQVDIKETTSGTSARCIYDGLLCIKIICLHLQVVLNASLEYV